MKEQYPAIEGIFHGSQKHFGFVRGAEGGEDWFVPAGATLNAWDGDTVTLVPTSVARRAGRVVRVENRANRVVTGRLQRSGRQLYLVPDNNKIPYSVLISGKAKGLATNSRVAVQILSYGTATAPAMGSVVENFGDADTLEAARAAILYRYNVEETFPPHVLSDAEKIQQTVAAQDFAGREDFRNLVIITIDGASAKDLDDAVSLTHDEKGRRVLGVHIADVSHYVAAKSALDQEAFARGTSVYYVEKVAPMLPKAISNNICSLNPQVDRLTLSCLMTLDEGGNVVESRIVKGVIRTVNRLNYDEVNAFLRAPSEGLRTPSEGLRGFSEGSRGFDVDLAGQTPVLEGENALPHPQNADLNPQNTPSNPQNTALNRSNTAMNPQGALVSPEGGIYDGPLSEHAPKSDEVRALVTELDRLARQRRKMRRQRGALELTSTESYFEFDGQGNPIAVHARESGPAERLIEECMLLANETVAQFLSTHGYPGVFRVHEKPSEEKVAGLKGLLRPLGYDLKDGSAQQLQKLLEHYRDAPEEGAVNQMVLRSMMKAKYAPENQGHFGLGAEFYCHFTSPIRRYPDLMVHRILTAILAGADTAPLKRFTPEAARQSSEREIAAATAEREICKLYMAQYMTSHIGEAFTGYVTGVSRHGLFVGLANGVEGFLPTAALPRGRYDFHEDTMTLHGPQGDYSFGTEVEVVCAGADAASGRVDFAPAGQEGSASSSAFRRSDRGSAARPPRPVGKKGGRKPFKAPKRRKGRR